MLQTLSITFTGSPIPFGKISFPPAAIQDIIKNIKNAISKGKSYMNELKKEFTNPLRVSIDQAAQKIRSFTDDNFQGLQNALPDLFNNTNAAVVAARADLLLMMGNAASAADQKFLGMPISDLSALGSNLYDSVNTFVNHTNEISGVGPDDKVVSLQTMYGNVITTGATVNVNSTNVATVNVQSSYPRFNIGDQVIINTQLVTITGKQYTAVAGGTVSVDTGTANLKVATASVGTMNLAAISVSSGMYINVNSEIKQVNTVNSYGDYLTVYTPFTNSTVGASLNKESKIVVNTAISTTASDLIIYNRTAFIANSLCLDNVVTGNGTAFSSFFSANDKIYYDEKEYVVQSVTDTKLYLDEPVRYIKDAPVYKIIIEYPVSQFIEGKKPEDILSAFATIDQMTTSMGSNLTQGMTTVFMNSNGQLETIDASSPSAVTKSLKNGPVLNAVGQAIQNLIDNLHGDAIRLLTNSDIVALIAQQKDAIEAVRNNLIDSVKRDIAALNAIKGLLQGLLKLFIISCSKKKAKMGDTSSDDYLSTILMPNPQRQGCTVATSDLISIFDTSDDQYNDPGLADRPYIEYQDTAPTEDTYTLPDLQITFVDEEEQNPGEGADVGIDLEPDLPVPVEDPCAKPC